MKIEPCNCEQALFQKKLARKLALAVGRFCWHENQKKYGTIQYLAETIAPLAERVIKEIK